MSRAAAKEDRRIAVLDAAARLLAAEGAGALTMRRVAAEVGASTQVLYTLFSSKDGLSEALVEEGFRRFGEALSRVEHDDPWRHLRALGRAYRRFALDNPDYYVMLWSGLQRPDFAAKPPGGEIAWQALVAAVVRVYTVLGRPAAEIEPMALSMWSAVHGFCSLELAGIAGGDEAFDEVLDMGAAAMLYGHEVRRLRQAMGL